jgi:hypothetical protein
MLPVRYNFATYRTITANLLASAIDTSDYLNGKENYKRWRAIVLKVLGSDLAVLFTSLEHGEFEIEDRGRQPEDAGLYEFLITVVSEEVRKVIMTPVGKFRGNPYFLWNTLAEWYTAPTVFAQQ